MKRDDCLTVAWKEQGGGNVRLTLGVIPFAFPAHPAAGSGYGRCGCKRKRQDTCWAVLSPDFQAPIPINNHSALLMNALDHDLVVTQALFLFPRA